MRLLRIGAAAFSPQLMTVTDIIYREHKISPKIITRCAEIRYQTRHLLHVLFFDYYFALLLGVSFVEYSKQNAPFVAVILNLHVRNNSVLNSNNALPVMVSMLYSHIQHYH